MHEEYIAPRTSFIIYTIKIFCKARFISIIKINYIYLQMWKIFASSLKLYKASFFCFLPFKMSKLFLVIMRIKVVMYVLDGFLINKLIKDTHTCTPPNRYNLEWRKKKYDTILLSINPTSDERSSQTKLF